MSQLLLRMVFVLSLVFANNADAQENMTADYVTKRLEILVSDNSILPQDILTELDTLIAASEANNWQDEFLSAVTLKAEVLSIMDDFPAASAVVKQYLPSVEQAGHKRLIARLQMVQLSVYDATGYNEEVERHITDLLNSIAQWGYGLEAGSIYVAVGHSYLLHGVMDKSLINLKKAYDIFVEFDDKANLSYTLNSLANLYTDMGDLPTAIVYLEESLAINKALNDKLSSSIVASNLGGTYTKAHQYDKALAMQNESLQLAIEIEDEVGVAWANIGIAEVYVAQNKPEDALVLFIDTLATFEEIGENRELFNARIGMFDCYMMLDQLGKAAEQIPFIDNLQAELNNPKYQLEIDRRIAKLNYQEGQYQQAFDALSRYNDSVEKLHEEENLQNLQNLKVSFDTEIKDNQNEVLQKENELQQLKIEQQQNERVFWILVVGLAVTTTIIAGYLLLHQTRSRNKFKNLALYDHLTNAPNRRAILNIASDALAESARQKSTFSVVLVDLDRFKMINDEYGHDVGDEVLKAFASGCTASLRKHDHFGRYGGEEWLLVLNDTSHEDIGRILLRLHETINQQKVGALPEEVAINFSAGVADFSVADKMSLLQLIAQADKHLYAAKNSGRNRVQFDDNVFVLP